MKMNEEGKFAMHMKKLKGICEENDIQAVFGCNGYPITLTISPLQGAAQQMNMLENVEEEGYTSPDASIKFSYRDGEISYTLSKEFVIDDNLFTKLKNQFKKLHDTWLQYFHRQVVEKRLLNASNFPTMPEDPDGFGDLEGEAADLIDTDLPEAYEE